MLLVIECLRGRDHDRLAGMDAYRVEILHVADGDAVVAQVAHHLVLDLLPAAQRLLDQHLLCPVGKRPAQGFIELIDGIDYAAALAAQGIGHAQHHRQADFSHRSARGLDRGTGTAARGLDADFIESIDE